VAGSGSGQSLRAAAGLSAVVDGNSGNFAAGEGSLSALASLAVSGLAGLADFFGRGFDIRRVRGSALSASVLVGVEGVSLMEFRPEQARSMRGRRAQSDDNCAANACGGGPFTPARRNTHLALCLRLKTHHP
jgi:hypothetical protein